MGNYQSQLDAVTKDVQGRIMKLDLVRDLNRMAVEKLQQEPHRLQNAQFPAGIDGFEAAKNLLSALSQELRNKSQGADQALRRGDSLGAQKLVEEAEGKVEEHNQVADLVRKMADIALEHGSGYAATMSQRAVKTMIPAPVRYGVLCVGHTCCLPYWDSKYDAWLY
ncbi:hypothetical protein GNI_063920 [Gregarina niphandrodes]|uniref:Uncharacterized protein n=1 Tax=Gregarina niphandrodes TaxID=110365 RepID=A0A023B802_GRENI|nr:hypothetical protein GNI_063920 [Gregarina niphandrodes]EZG68172.1 hypothetical protein GNI_063920 [Gregarina niphandrodes]|eukprot:XP_011130066.1 hypothetical protein GNI_063920 [Gregarina niphandrodes]